MNLIKIFGLQRMIFGLCPHCEELFRLSDAQIYTRTKPKLDWMTALGEQENRLERLEEKLEVDADKLREKSQHAGRLAARRAIKKIDPIFRPRRLDPDDAKVLFHPIDFTVFKGMKSADKISKIILLDRKKKGPLQRSIERAIEKGRYEWVTIRVNDDGKVVEE